MLKRNKIRLRLQPGMISRTTQPLLVAIRCTNIQQQGHGTDLILDLDAGPELDPCEPRHQHQNLTRHPRSIASSPKSEAENAITSTKMTWSDFIHSIQNGLGLMVITSSANAHHSEEPRQKTARTTQISVSSIKGGKPTFRQSQVDDASYMLDVSFMSGKSFLRVSCIHRLDRNMVSQIFSNNSWPHWTFFA